MPAPPLPVPRARRPYRHIPEAQCLDAVLQWFRAHAADAEVEIEARVKDVTDDEFDFVTRRLASNPNWTSDRTTKMVDVTYPGYNRVRGTFDATAPAETRTVSFIKKDRVVYPVDVSTGAPWHIVIRFSLTREVAVPGPPPGTVGDHFRIKSRRSFVHKRVVAYELTRVQTGESESDAEAQRPQCEVELEWCGQAAMSSAGAPSVDDAALGFLSNVDDVVDMVVQRRLRAGGSGIGNGNGIGSVNAMAMAMAMAMAVVVAVAVAVVVVAAVAVVAVSSVATRTVEVVVWVWLGGYSVVANCLLCF